MLSLSAGLLLCLASSVPSARGAERTWLVDFFGASDADFEEIQAAVDAALDGDTILIRTQGLYDGFTVVDKSLVISAEAGGRVELELGDRIEVRDLSAGKSLVLRGFGPEVIGSSGPPTTLVASDCTGTLWLEDCSLAASPNETGLSLTNCLSVVVTDCRVEGAPALSLSSTGMHLFSSSITGIDDAGAGAELDASFTFVSGSTILGAEGNLYPASTPCVGDGGDGFVLSSASELYVQDSVILGGSIDPSGLGYCTVIGNPTVGSPGQPIVQDPASVVVNLAGSAHTYATTPLVRDGGTFTRTFQGEPGELVYFFQADATEPTFLEHLNGSTLTSSSATLTPLGALDATGRLVQTVPAVLGAADGRTTFEQALYLGASGVGFAGSGATATVVDAAIALRTGPDCNRNGIADPQDLALGISLDCNRNGLPDECEPFSPVRLRKFQASDGAAGQAFGHAIDAAGDTLVVGQPGRNGGVRGAVYVYERVAGVWAETKIASPNAADRNFGNSVALEGDTLVIGVPGYRNAASPFTIEGRAYVYERVGGTWMLAQSLDVAVTGHDRHFGEQVALENGELIVTAPAGSVQSGSCSSTDQEVFVYRKVGASWTLAQTLPDLDLGGFCFGLSMALDGTSLVIGAPRSGWVQTYELQGVSWVEAQLLVSPDQGAGFGSSIALQGDTLVIGALSESRFESGDGAIYVYERGLGQWKLAAVSKLATLGPEGHGLGQAVGLTGDLIIGGSQIDTGPGAAGAFLFPRQPDGRWPRFQSTSFSLFAIDSVAPWGGDQLFLGATTGRGKAPDTGAVYLYDIRELMVPNPCLLGGPTTTSVAPAPQAR